MDPANARKTQGSMAMSRNTAGVLSGAVDDRIARLSRTTE